MYCFVTDLDIGVSPIRHGAKISANADYSSMGPTRMIVNSKLIYINSLRPSDAYMHQ